MNLPKGDTEGVVGLCLDPHDLAISKYVAGREKDLHFTAELARRGILELDRLLQLLPETPFDASVARLVRARIRRDFG